MSQQDFNRSTPPQPPITKGLSDDALLDLVQKQTLRYFTDFAHPVSGMARERSNIPDNKAYDLDCVTTGGTGFGIMALLAGTSRGWISPKETQTQIEKIVDFLKTAEKHHGAFPHFLDGRNGKTIAFSPKDDGGDLVETSFLMMGLLTARQYYKNNPDAQDLCHKINTLWQGVEWDWYTQGSTDTLYWHWSPNHGFDMDLPVEGWNESLVTHLLARASPTHAVPDTVYAQSWLGGKDFANGKDHHGIKLPLGPDGGGPLFMSQYSFMGINPTGLSDAHADYFEQNRNHTLINRAHCIDNPHGHKGYGPACWGLTASDDPQGYAAHAPDHDNGVISPTAALGAFPYTPKESMQALRYFYEEKGDKIFGTYGFTDAFCENKNWYAKSHLAIDQGPIVVMIENARSGLLWDLFMSCPEVKHGLNTLGFKSNPAPQTKPAPPKNKPTP